MKNKLISLLLEIYEKEIYKKYDCETIYQYAFKYAKLSKETVQLALRTLKNTEDKPELRSKIETEGLYKVSMVAKLATGETDKIWAEHVENMSKPALLEFAKEIRNGATESQKEISKKCEAVVPKMTIELDEEMQIMFNKLKQKHAKNFSNQEALRVIFKKLIAETQSGFKKAKSGVPGNGITVPSRSIPAAKKRQIQEKTDGKCAYPNCTKPIENYHHRIPFNFQRSHDSVVGLCETHHEFAHNGLIKHELKEPEQWKLSLNGAKSVYDNLQLKYRN